jgi:trimeric autotransporter adhesin
MSLKLRRGTNAERLAFTPEVGELIYTTDSKQLYAGDGTTVGGTLVSYAGSVGGAMGSNLVLSGFNITGAGNINIEGTINSTGNIVSGGTITATGDIIANGNITLGNSNTDNVTIGADVNSNIIPNITETFDLGSESQRWNTLHVNNVVGDLEGNVRAGDSTVLVDAQAGVLRGVHIGSLQGNVAGNVAGNVTGDVTGSVRSANGTIILNNGTDGTDAVFTGQLNGSVLNGVLTTESYFDPSWITGLNGNKIYGSIGGGSGVNQVFFNGILQGSVFAEDSSTLVDAIEGVLRGTHIGNLRGTVYTGVDDAEGALSIIGNTISTDTDDDLILATQGDGNVSVPGTIEVNRLSVGNDPVSGGVTIINSTNAAQPFVTFGAYDSTSSSSGTGAAAIFSRARGIPTAPTTLENGDEIATLVFSGASATPAIPSAFKDAANIMAKAVSVSTGVFVEGRLEFRTTNDSGVSATKLAINGDGSLEMTDSLLAAGGGVGQVDISAPVKFVKVFIGATAYAMPLYAIN